VLESRSVRHDVVLNAARTNCVECRNRVSNLKQVSKVCFYMVY